MLSFPPCPQTTLLVFALEAEARSHFEGFHSLFCGVGKINAAHRLARDIAAWKQHNNEKPRLVLNVGSAGSSHFSRGTIVNCTSFIQRDFDATALGAAPYQTPFESVPTPLANGLRLSAHPEGLCGTGDSFVISNKDEAWNVVDMEAYALAKICFEEKIPFACLKYITDSANEDAPSDWLSTLDRTARALRQAVDAYLMPPS